MNHTHKSRWTRARCCEAQVPANGGGGTFAAVKSNLNPEKWNSIERAVLWIDRWATETSSHVRKLEEASRSI